MHFVATVSSRREVVAKVFTFWRSRLCFWSCSDPPCLLNILNNVQVGRTWFGVVRFWSSNSNLGVFCQVAMALNFHTDVTPLNSWKLPITCCTLACLLVQPACFGWECVVGKARRIWDKQRHHLAQACAPDVQVFCATQVGFSFARMSLVRETSAVGWNLQLSYRDITAWLWKEVVDGWSTRILAFHRAAEWLGLPLLEAAKEPLEGTSRTETSECHSRWNQTWIGGGSTSTLPTGWCEEAEISNDLQRSFGAATSVRRRQLSISWWHDFLALCRLWP